MQCSTKCRRTSILVTILFVLMVLVMVGCSGTRGEATPLPPDSALIAPTPIVASSPGENVGSALIAPTPVVTPVPTDSNIAPIVFAPADESDVIDAAEIQPVFVIPSPTSDPPVINETHPQEKGKNNPSASAPPANIAIYYAGQSVEDGGGIYVSPTQATKETVVMPLSNGGWLQVTRDAQIDTGNLLFHIEYFAPNSEFATGGTYIEAPACGNLASSPTSNNFRCDELGQEVIANTLNPSHAFTLTRTPMPEGIGCYTLIENNPATKNYYSAGSCYMAVPMPYIEATIP